MELHKDLSNEFLKKNKLFKRAFGYMTARERPVDRLKAFKGFEVVVHGAKPVVTNLRPAASEVRELNFSL